MKTLPRILLGAGLGVLLTSCASESLVTRTQVSAPSGRCSSIEGRVFEQVNAYRRAQGLGELQRHSGLDRLARQHAQFMLDNQGKFGLHGKTVTHYGFEERAMMARHSMNISSLGENVIAGQPGGGDVGATLVRVWRGSPGHLANMTQGWGLTGIGVAVDDQGCVCATQLFGSAGVSSAVSSASSVNPISPFAGPMRQF